VEELRKMLLEKDGEIESMRALLELEAESGRYLRETLERVQGIFRKVP
jgi:hypothetical protein